MVSVQHLGLKHQFLLAMPHLEDPHFAGTLSYLCDHDENGTMGVIVNKHRHAPVYYGGPTHKDRGFILHRGSSSQWDSSIQVDEDIALTTSMDILLELAAGRGPKAFLVCLGCAGWGAGQLAEELKENAWLTVEADADILFTLPAEQRLNAAAGILGVDLNLITREAGHS